MNRKPIPLKIETQCPPNRATNPLPARCDNSRRRFLRQLAGSTGLCVVGLPKLAHGQSPEIDFSRLDRHRSIDALTPTDIQDADEQALLPEMEYAEEEAVDEDEAFDSRPTEISENDPETPSGDDNLDGSPSDSDPPPVQYASIEESRALWIEPGYLLLVRWSRPEEDETSIAALENASQSLGEFLSTRVTSVDNLHNLDQLHQVEWELVELLTPLVDPAEISVLHLDHDCTQVCSLLDPSYGYPDIYELDGEMPAVYWE